MHAARRVQYAPAERGNFRAIESPDANRHIIKEFPSSSASWRRVRPDEHAALGLCVRILRVIKRIRESAAVRIGHCIRCSSRTSQEQEPTGRRRDTPGSCCIDPSSLLMLHEAARRQLRCNHRRRAFALQSSRSIRKRRS